MNLFAGIPRGQALEKRLREPTLIVMLAALYYMAGKLGLILAFVHPSSTAVWAPTGIALAALIMLGYRVWPGIWIGAFLVNATTAGSLISSAGIATGNTLEALLGAYLVIRFAHGRKCFDSAQDTLKFAAFAGLLSTAIAATCGVTVLSAEGFARWADYKSIWLTWWLGDAAGAVIAAPLLLLWGSNFRLRRNWSRFSEFAALILGLGLVAEIVFCGLLFPAARSYPLEYLCIPFLLWVALRFGQREAAVATLLLSGIAIWGTIHRFGPFAIGKPNDSLLLLQSFTGIIGVMTMALAAMTAERRRTEEQARNLAITDPLTGLANYRKLLDVLDLEIKRFDRTARPFAVLLLDLDGLKQINDSHGHLTGSRALCRLADILRVYCRSIDTAARYGGDEFALVIPEAGWVEAQQVTLRIGERLAQDREEPAISASIGAAVYPRDGITIEKLLGAADAALYRMKRRTHEAMHLQEGPSSGHDQP